jgi:ribonucleoside-diphosphate reductase alpha chain
MQEKDLTLTLTHDSESVSSQSQAEPKKSRKPKAKASGGLVMQRHFTEQGKDPFDYVTWEHRTAAISNDKGEKIFEQKDVEVPAAWSQTATNIVVQKYFRGGLNQPTREKSIRHMIDRVSRTITEWGKADGYFASDADAETFYAELTYLLVTQRMSFNSPVWFNCGIEERPQLSACFINSVTDTMEGIMDLAKTEAMLFKFGSGTGTNRSTIRSQREQLSTGGYASGPVSFMRGFDAFAGVIKSGGKTRRAAKMDILNVEHPDIVDFITAKPNEEKKAWALIEAGYDGNFTGEAYGSVFFQNSNLSVRVTDEFMTAYEQDGVYHTKAVKDGRIMETLKARDIMRMIAEGTYICGDPGMQYDTTINTWHTCKASDRIYASNPCSEYMFLDDSACNLASLNLMKFVNADGSYGLEAYKHAIGVTILAQEIMVGNASYPTKKIEINSFDYRPLGLGYANLGSLLMSLGLAYDSERGRAYAGALTAILSGEAYRMSAEIAKVKDPFAGFEKNRKSMLGVIKMHRDAVEHIDSKLVSSEMLSEARNVWDAALELGTRYGYKNSQVTVLAPTGTIGFMMDCDTTGIEPDIALVKYKRMVGGGVMKLVNNTVPLALKKLGYSDAEIKGIVAYIAETGTIEGSPYLKEEHLDVFDCAFKAMNGTRTIHYMGHIRMMAAAQPFLSGAISKTVNLPTDCTVEDIAKAYFEAWKLGLKAVAIYRDGSKRTQPLSTSLKDSKGKAAELAAKDSKPSDEPKEEVKPIYAVMRRRLPDERESVTHKFAIAGHDGYITVGKYEDGTPGEIFITMAKEGSTISGLMDAFATSVSLALQYGVPIEVLANKFSHMRFEPSGFTNNRQIPIAKSIVDYIFRWLSIKFMPTQALHLEEATDANLTGEAKHTGGTVEQFMQKEQPSVEAKAKVATHATAVAKLPMGFVPAKAADDAARLTKAAESLTVVGGHGQTFQNSADAPACHVCGNITVRSGACYKCFECGSTTGCS